MEWSNGRKFRGSWENDLKQGYGILTNADGSTIKGTWFDNKQHGYGIYISAN